MNGREFRLQPFSPLSPHSAFTITGNLARRAGELAISYVLCGPLRGLRMPAPALLPARKSGLWQETCFEFFLGVKDAAHYWEFNLSPAGHWNIYRFAGYREEMAEERAFRSLPLRVRCRPDSLELALELELDRIIAADQPLAVAVAAVIQDADGGLSYWALTHPGPQPDFHRRDGFLLER